MISSNDYLEKALVKFKNKNLKKEYISCLEKWKKESNITVSKDKNLETVFQMLLLFGFLRGAMAGYEIIERS